MHTHTHTHTHTSEYTRNAGKPAQAAKPRSRLFNKSTTGLASGPCNAYNKRMASFPPPHSATRRDNINKKVEYTRNAGKPAQAAELRSRQFQQIHYRALSQVPVMRAAREWQGTTFPVVPTTALCNLDCKTHTVTQYYYTLKRNAPG